MNYEKLSEIKAGSNAGLYGKCYFSHASNVYHNLFSFMFCLKNVSDNVDNYQRTRKSKTSALHGVKFVINVLCKHSAFTLCVFHLNG